MAGWQNAHGLLLRELTQAIDEGAVIPSELQARIDALDPAGDAWNDAATAPLWEALDALPRDAALTSCEPDELAAIQALRPADRIDNCGHEWTDTELLDRLHGAWACRASGCALGKPVEGPAMRRDEDGRLCGRRTIEQYLREHDAWPLENYFPVAKEGACLGLGRHGNTQSLRGHIAYMPADDDIHYTLLGLHVLEKHGPDFTWQDVAFGWTNLIPFGSICTAETQALLNFWNNSVRWPGEGNVGIEPDRTRRHRNPYREWIGAQIRADGWAWACAGKPALAAEFAWRDASWTHTRNGIYGEMFCAAMQAAAFVETDVKRIVQIGLGQIPADCRLAKAVRGLLQWVESCPDWQACMQRVEDRYQDMDPVHTINNALIVVLALCYGGLDAVRAPAIAVSCALDTDCNGATVGSIVGAAIGHAAIDKHLIGQLNDTIRPSMIGFQEVRMRDLAERHLRVWQAVDAHAAGRVDVAVG